MRLNHRQLVLAAALAAAGSWIAPTTAKADAHGVGLGVAAGVDLYDTQDIDLSASFAWGFFVDIPLLDTFYITPAAMIYEVKQGGSKIPATDVDLNFKFIVPLGRLSLGAGVTAGITTGFGDYRGHYGALGYLGWNLVSNLDLFVLAQYKRLTDSSADYNNIHAYGGTMFRF